MRFLACEPTCGGKCSAAQCFACLTNCATALVVTGLWGDHLEAERAAGIGQLRRVSASVY